MSEICLCSVAWEWIDGIRPNVTYALTLTRSMLGLLCFSFCKFTTRLWPLVVVKIFVSAQYLENKLMEFYQILHMYWPEPDLGWDFKSIFLQIYNTVTALGYCQNFVYRLTSCEWMDGIWSYFAYALSLTRSCLEFSADNIQKYISNFPRKQD